MLFRSPRVAAATIDQIKNLVGFIESGWTRRHCVLKTHLQKLLPAILAIRFVERLASIGSHFAAKADAKVVIRDETSKLVVLLNQLTLTCDDPGLPLDENNLVLKAAYALQRHVRGSRGASHGDTKELGARIHLGDTMGEMAFYYAACDVAIIGGTFAPLGGQNLIEALAAGAPVVSGPSTYNFSEVKIGRAHV